MMLATVEEIRAQCAEEHGAAAGAGALLAALVPALAAAERDDDVPSYVRTELHRQVTRLLNATSGFTAKFERSL